MRRLELDPDLADPERVARNLVFATDGRSLAAVLGKPDSGRRVLVQYDLDRNTGRIIPEPTSEDEGREDAPDPAVSPDLEIVAEVLLDYTEYDFVRLTDTWAKPPEVVELPVVGDGMHFTAVGFAANGSVLLTGIFGLEINACRVHRWNVSALLNGANSHEAELEALDLPAETESTAFADHGTIQAVGTSQGAIIVFDLLGERRPFTLVHDRRRARRVSQLDFSPDGQMLATRSAGTVAVWAVASGEEVARLSGRHPLTGFAFTPDGGAILVASTDGTVSRFDTSGFAAGDRFDWGLGSLHSVAVAPDGLTAAAGGEAGQVVMWDV